MFFDLNHLEETDMSYMEHLQHGITMSMWLFLCSFLAFINCFFTVNFFQNFIIDRITTIYNGVMLRWFRYSSTNEMFCRGPKKDSLRQKIYKKEYVESIKKGIIKPFNKIKIFYMLFSTAVSSTIHCFIPQILTYHAAYNTIKLYFNFEIVEKSNGK